MNALVNDFKQWYSQLPIREQIMLAIVSAIVIIYLLMIMVWQPLNESRERLHQRNRVSAETLAEVKTLVAQYKQASQNGAAAAAKHEPERADEFSGEGPGQHLHTSRRLSASGWRPRRTLLTAVSGPGNRCSVARSAISGARCDGRAADVR